MYREGNDSDELDHVSQPGDFMAKTVLIVDDDPTQRRLLQAVVEKSGFSTLQAGDGDAALAMALGTEQDKIHVMLLDLVMPGRGGMETLEELARKRPDLPVIVLTGKGSIDAVVKAMKAGARDFVVKPAAPERIIVSIRNALDMKTLVGEVKRLKKTAEGGLSFDDLIGNASSMRSVVAMGERGARANIPILITGESGVGKEVIARAIQSASEDLAKTIDDILDIAAIEANVLDLELGDVDVYHVLEHSLDYVATKAEDTRISMVLKCPKDIGIIRADETRLKQVVYNLLSNALRFTKPGGVIELGGKAADGGGVMIWVKDDGVGIPSERQPQVFASFESSRGGAGLGLALVQRFVERHGGWVELESEENEGTHVTVYLPKEAATDAAHPELFDKIA